MSVFRVKLNQGNQGTLDIDPATGVEFSTSVQRTMFVTGPNGKIREIADGTTFTDCNYWKQFAVPAVSVDDAFIEVVTDDGSVYSDIASENTYPAVTNITLTSGKTLVSSGNIIDIAGDTGNFASFMQLTNAGFLTSGNNAIVQLNGSSGAIFVLEAGSTQVFNGGDIAINRVAIQPQMSGATGVFGTFNIEALYSVVSQCNS
jgi:hypothetical protein